MPHAQSADACLWQVYGYMGPISKIKRQRWKDLVAPPSEGGGGEHTPMFISVL